MRGDQLARQWRLIRAIETSANGLTVSDLAKSEEIGVRTIYRDLEALQEAGFPLYVERDERSNRWAFVDNYKFNLSPPFSLTELMALYFYQDLVKVFKGTPLYDSLESIFKKIRVTLPAETQAYLNQIQSSFSVGIKPYKDYGRFREILNQVNKAVINRKRIEMAYHSLKSQKEILRKVDPYKVWFYEGTIYLIGYCHLRQGIRTFVLDRIKMLNLTKEKFRFPDNFNLEDYLRDSFKVMKGDQLHNVTIRISPQWARWAGEKIWHVSQKSKVLKDGSLELSFQVTELSEVKQWVLSLGPEAYVVEPEELKEVILNDLNQVLDQYLDKKQSRLRKKSEQTFL